MQVRDPGFATLLTNLRNAALVDYTGVAAAKLPMLESSIERSASIISNAGLRAPRPSASFSDEGGAALERYATFEALAEHFRGDKWGHFPWRDWPAPYRDPNSPETRVPRAIMRIA